MKTSKILTAVGALGILLSASACTTTGSGSGGPAAAAKGATAGETALVSGERLVYDLDPGQSKEWGKKGGQMLGNDIAGKVTVLEKTSAGCQTYRNDVVAGGQPHTISGKVCP